MKDEDVIRCTSRRANRRREMEAVLLAIDLGRRYEQYLVSTTLLRAANPKYILSLLRIALGIYYTQSYNLLDKL